MRRILILGSTGSIGVQALDVVERSDELEVVGLAAQTRGRRPSSRRASFGVERIALADEDAAARARRGLDRRRRCWPAPRGSSS